MKLVLVLLSLMVTMSCCDSGVERIKPKFKKGEIVIIEGEKYVVDYSQYHSYDETYVYNVDNLKTGNSLDVNENSIIKYVKDETQDTIDSTLISESDTIAY